MQVVKHLHILLLVGPDGQSGGRNVVPRGGRGKLRLNLLANQLDSRRFVEAEDRGDQHLPLLCR